MEGGILRKVATGLLSRSRWWWVWAKPW